ncbi:Sugar phosphate permease [Bacillus sp. OV322]|uniref:MFS transporter n=1 Tax=Bacillus sp. OV322 TaxID=1882764 RepID=UPI0008E654A4|nr:MFS transporter [Bacillus sp. OV322]SFC35268.1 Sugar phosphate permease [Bacillus sp. OV322]
MNTIIKTFKKMTPLSKAAIAGILISSLGTFMFMPYVSIYISDLGYRASFVGVVLLMFSISQQGFTFFGGYLSDKLGTKYICLAGLSIRIAGYIMFLFSLNKALIIMSAVLVGLGGALITPSLKVTMSIGNEEIRSSVFALRNTVINFGAAIGPILGGVLYVYSINAIFLSAAILHVLVFLLIARKKQIVVEAEEKGNLPSPSIWAIFNDKRILYLTFAVSFFYFLYVQFNLSVPIYIKDFYHKPELSGTLFTFNGILIIVLQYPVMIFFQKKFQDHIVLVLGMFSLACAFITLVLSETILILFLFTFLLTLGEILLPPTLDNIATKLAPKKLMGSYLGFMTFSFMIGGGLGSLIGGYGYEWGSDHNIRLLWMLYSLVGLAGASLIWPVKKFLKESAQESIKEDAV